MTSNQIAYWNFRENERANQAREREAERSNKARELETILANRNREAENIRHNLQGEKIDQVRNAQGWVNTVVNSFTGLSKNFREGMKVGIDSAASLLGLMA